jgi:FkbM family methyltransferase
MSREITEYPLIKWRMKAPWISRFAYLSLLLRGKMSFGDFSAQLQRGRYKSKELRDKGYAAFSGWINQSIRSYLNEDGSMTLFGNKLYPFKQNCEELVWAIPDIILDDQYDVKGLVKDGSIVIDAGANLGMFSIAVARYSPHSAVYGFEPVPDTFRSLVKNVAPYPNVKVFNKGLGEATTKREMLVSSIVSSSNMFQGSAAIDLPLPGEVTRMDLAITTIDDVVASERLPRVDFIKMDTEGYEAKILTGARETIKKFKPTIVMSAYHAPGDKKALPEILKGICSDYKTELHGSAEEDFVCRV